MIDLKQKLIEAIRDEKNSFDMSRFFGSWNQPACGTARCMAGHIIGIVKSDARPIDIQEIRDFDEEGCLTTSTYAASLWKEATGEPCLLDFFGFLNNTYTETEGKVLEDFTREEAISHILGTNPDWPQYATEEEANNANS